MRPQQWQRSVRTKGPLAPDGVGGFLFVLAPFGVSASQRKEAGMFAHLIGGPHDGQRVPLRVVNDRIRVQDPERSATYRRDPDDYNDRRYDEAETTRTAAGSKNAQ